MKYHRYVCYSAPFNSRTLCHKVLRAIYRPDFRFYGDHAISYQLCASCGSAAKAGLPPPLKRKLTKALNIRAKELNLLPTTK